jgi:D-3-phosphoglycerate dehydrogenase
MGQKIGFLASQMNKAPIVSIKVSGRGDIAEYVNSLATFVTVGALADISGDTINYVNADFVAKERGIKIETEELPASIVYKNLVTVKLTTDKNVIEISATMFGDDVQRIVDINGFGVDVEPKGNMILFKNTDVPGVIGQVGTLLAAHEVNIADFRLGRNKSGEALAVIIVDSVVSDKTLKELSALKACISVSYARI